MRYGVHDIRHSEWIAELREIESVQDRHAGDRHAVAVNNSVFV